MTRRVGQKRERPAAPRTLMVIWTHVSIFPIFLLCLQYRYIYIDMIRYVLNKPAYILFFILGWLCSISFLWTWAVPYSLCMEHVDLRPLWVKICNFGRVGVGWGWYGSCYGHEGRCLKLGTIVRSISPFQTHLCGERSWSPSIDTCQWNTFPCQAWRERDQTCNCIPGSRSIFISSGQ